MEPPTRENNEAPKCERLGTLIGWEGTSSITSTDVYSGNELITASTHVYM